MRKYSRHIKLVLILFTAAVLVIVTGPNPVKAQGSTVVGMSPSATTACVGTPITIHVSVQDVINLQAYDLRVDFTPGSITVQSMETSGWLGDPNGEEEFWQIRNTINNTTGVLRQAGTKLGAPPVSGSNALINITLVATVANQTVNFTVFPDSGNNALSDNNGVRIPYTAANGVVYTRNCDPTAANTLSFSSQESESKAILNWETSNESDNLGFNLFRATSADGTRKQINPALIPTNVPPGSLEGAAYSYTDGGSDLGSGLSAGQTYYYWLQSVSVSGTTETFGPVSLTIPGNGVQGNSSSITESMGSATFSGNSASTTGLLYSAADIGRKKFHYSSTVAYWRLHHPIHSAAYYEFLRSHWSSPIKAHYSWQDAVHFLSQGAGCIPTANWLKKQ